MDNPKSMTINSCMCMSAELAPDERRRRACVRVRVRVCVRLRPSTVSPALRRRRGQHNFVCTLDWGLL